MLKILIDLALAAILAVCTLKGRRRGLISA
jgi:uncharacterized membrane protein required for colicin V production